MFVVLQRLDASNSYPKMYVFGGTVHARGLDYTKALKQKREKTKNRVLVC
jgi:hypothetical protein